MTARRGITLIELVIVLSVIGILATIGVSRARDWRERAQGAQLIEAVHKVQVAFAAAGAPSGAALSAPAGTVSDLLASHLRPDAFAPIEGIRMWVVAGVRSTLLLIRADGDEAQRVLYAFHTQAG
jgi:prepilin-type N-terminal cleavage/methylation domain-containing protein